MSSTSVGTGALVEKVFYADAMYIPFAGLNPIITMKDKKLVVMHGLKRLHNATPRNIVLLGEHTVTKKSWFAVDINQTPFEFGDEKAVDLRVLLGLTDDETASMLCHAKGLLGWNLKHQFCANCGKPTVGVEGGMKRTCAACGTGHFPRTDPVVITLVYHGDRVLLGRQKIWPAGRYSCVAGFLDTGETIEQGVQREVLEETGVTVSNIRYYVSQPWPNYSQIMIGCFSEAIDDKIAMNDNELEDAKWFTADELKEALALPDVDFQAKSDGKFRLPSRYAVAHVLVRGFLEGKHKTL